MEDAKARKERLKALKQAAATAEANEPSTRDPEPEPEAPVLKFRNYIVKDDKIEHEVVAPAVVPKFVEPVVDKQEQESNQEELLLNVAPKKANWDLKRDVQDKLDKLERRTQRAIVGIMQDDEKERMEAEGGVQD
eukprot:gene23793-9355_t